MSAAQHGSVGIGDAKVNVGAVVFDKAFEKIAAYRPVPVYDVGRFGKER